MKHNTKQIPSLDQLQGSIQTYSGRIVYPLNLTSSDVDIRDIAHSLSMKCRFSGHTKFFYSVAEHAVRVSYCLEHQMEASLKDQYKGLHHDDGEAYLVDLPSPLKALPEFQWFRGVEDKVQQVIYEALGFVDLTEPKIVKLADRILLVTEKRDLMPGNWDWESVYNLSPLPDKIIPLLPAEAEQLYLQRHKELKEKLQKAQDDSWDEYH